MPRYASVDAFIAMMKSWEPRLAVVDDKTPLPIGVDAVAPTPATFPELPLADVMQPAIRHAARGFAVTPYLSDCIKDAGPDLSKDKLAANENFLGPNIQSIASSSSTDSTSFT